ncbi:MAG: MATE family efflux transporter [Bacteroidetes bacterium]|nr:MATE family efflux transporter [Bacteroidota bacterium]
MLNKYLGHLKKLLQIAVPIVIVEAGHQLTHVIDTIMVGQLGAINIAASSLAHYLYMIPLLFCLGSTIAVTTLTGNANGSGNLPECKRLFSNAIFVQFINGTILTALTFALGYIIPIIDADIEKTALAHNYYNYLAFSSLFVIILFTFKGYIDAFGYTIYGMIAILLGNVVNIFLNWLLIYGNWGLPALGLEGAGIATLISRIFTLLFIITIVISIKKTRRLLIIPKLSHLRKSKIKDFFKYGLHIGTQSSVEIAAFTLIVVFAGWLGVAQAAAYQICINIAGLCFLSTFGIGAAATILISNYKGAGNIQGIKEASITIFTLSLLFTLICTIILIVGRDVFTSLFVNEQDVIILASSLLFILALFQIPDGLNVTISGILRGLLDTKIPMIINSISFWVIMIPIAYLLGFVFDIGVAGIMYGVVAGILICAISIIIRAIYTLKRVIRSDKKYLY